MASRNQQGSIAFAVSGVRVCKETSQDKTHTRSIILMSVEYLERPTCLNIPEHQAVVTATGHNAFFVGTKGDPGYIAVMPLQDLQRFPRYHIPHPASVI